MAAMLAVALDKTIVIVDAAEEQSELNAGKAQHGTGTGVVLELQADASLEKQLCIPLEKGTKAEQVTVENRYVDQELWIYIKNAEEDFYQDNVITGDVTHIGGCWYEVQKDGLLLKMCADAVWEYRSTMEDGNLKIAFSDPRDNYQQIVVLDPVGGGSESGITVKGCSEKELALQVAKLVQKKVNQEGIKIYLTRSEDTDVSDEQRLCLVQAVEPDLFLQIGGSEASEDAAQYGISSYYNDEYYIPEFGNAEWADVVTKKVTIASSNRALGLFPAEEDSVLKRVNVPAARICLGYLTNEQENVLLSQESYQEKLAQGIAEAILEVYTNTYTQK